jgi:hypothetical protein
LFAEETVAFDEVGDSLRGVEAGDLDDVASGPVDFGAGGGLVASKEGGKAKEKRLKTWSIRQRKMIETVEERYAQ